MNSTVVLEGNLSKIHKLYDDVYFRIGNLEIRDQCNSGIIELEHSVALIDYPGQEPDEELIEEAELLTKKPVKYIILTHAHCDHVTGLKTLSRKDVTLIARKECIDQIQLEGYPVPPIQMAITGSGPRNLDGFEFELIVPDHTAHSPWDLLVGVPKYKLIFTGDLLVREKYMFFHGSYITGWIQAIEKLMQSPWEKFALGHGFIEGKEHLDRALKYLKLLNSAKEILAKKDEYLDEQVVIHYPPTLNKELITILAELVVITDARNAIRQVNQLDLRTREGY